MEDKLGKRLTRQYFRSYSVWLAGYALLYFLPVLVWLQLSDSFRPALPVGLVKRLLPCYSAVMLTGFVIHGAVKYMRFSSRLKALTPAESAALGASLDSCKSFRFFSGTLYIADRVLYFTGGLLAPYGSVDSIELRESETDKLNVHHLYVYLHDGTSFCIPARKMSADFEELKKCIAEKNSGIEVTRQFKPAFGKKRKQN